MQVVYSLHAEEKLASSEARKLGITKTKIERVIGKPDAVGSSEKPVLIVIGRLTRELSLNAVYKRIEKGIKVITFYPAERGRYERKVLQGR